MPRTLSLTALQIAALSSANDTILYNAQAQSISLYGGTDLASTITELEINNQTGDCLKLRYNGDSNKYANFGLDSSGNLNLNVNGGDKSFNIVNHNGSTMGLKLGGTLVIATAAELNSLSGVSASFSLLNYLDSTPGTATANKAVIMDADNNISGINDLSTQNLTVNGTLVTASATELNYTDIATAGTAQASKALVVDNSRNITNLNNLTATNLTGTLQTASQPNITSVGTLDELTVTNGITTSSIDATSVLVGGTDITASLNSVAAVSGVTEGTVSASKALIVDSNKHLTGMGNLTSTGTISASTLTGQLSTAAQPNITSVGTLTSLALSGNISGAGTVSATNLTGTLTTASQPNVTSVGTLNGLTASGNVDISSHNGTTSGLKLNGTLVTAQASDLNKLPDITATATQLNYVSGVTAGVAAAGGAIVVDNNKDITGMRNVTVTGNISGASSVSATNLTGTLQTASQPNITSVGTLGDLTVTNDITADTVNANTFLLNGSDLTSSLGNVAAVDGVTAGTVTASKALIVDSNKNLTGMGDLTSTGTITATTLAGELSTASQPNITSVGTLNGLTASGNVNVSSHNGSTTGLTLNGTLVTANASDLNKLSGVTAGTVSASKAVIVDGSSNLSGVNNLTVTGDISGVGTLSATNLTGTLTTASQPSVTSVGTLTGLTANGNVNVAQHNGSTTGLTLNGTLVTANASDLNKLSGVTAGTVSASKAVIVDSSSNLTGINNLTVTGNITGISSLSATTLTGTLGVGAAAQTNITSVGTLTGLTVNNNLDIAQHDGSSTGLKLNGVLVTAQASDLNKLPNITATASQINTLTGITAGTVSASKAVVVDSNSDITGLNNVTVTGDISGVGTLSATTLTGSLSAGAQNNITTLTGATSVGQNDSTVLTGTLATASQPNITTLSGVTSVGQNSSTTLTGTLQTAAQTQITSVGTLSSLTLAGAVSGVTTLGSSGQITNTDSTASTTNSTGAVQLSGGIGINNTTDASSSTNGGTLTSAGGAAFAKSVYVGTNLNVGTNLTVGGNLTVSGTTTTINSTTTNILDNTIVLNSGPSVTGKDAGMITQRYQVDNVLGTGDVVNDTANESYAVVSSTTTTIVLPSDASSVDSFYTNWWIKVTSGSRINSVRQVTNYVGSTKTLTLDTALAGALTASDNISLYNKSYTAFVWNETNKRYATLFTTSDTDLTNLSASNYADFASGKIIGLSSTSTTSASTGSVQLSGGIGINNTTDASSSTNGGTLTSAGGAAFAKSVYVGTDLNIGGNSTLTGTLNVSGSSSLAGLSSSSNVVISGASSKLTIANTTASTSSSTGALQVAGGAYFGANSIVSGTLTTTGLSSSANVSVSGASSTLTIANTTASTSSSTGALQVAGGSYFGANSIMNANLSVNGSLIVNSTTVSGTDLAKLTSVLNGAGSASKALVLDSSRNIGNIASLSATSLTGTLQTGAQPNITTLVGVTSVGANSSTVLTGTLATASQPNITTLANVTTVGTLSSLTLVGGIAVNNTTDVSSLTSGGCLTLAGGAAVAKSVLVGTSIWLPNVSTVNPKTGTTSAIVLGDNPIYFRTAGTTSYDRNHWLGHSGMGNSNYHSSKGFGGQTSGPLSTINSTGIDGPAIVGNGGVSIGNNSGGADTICAIFGKPENTSYEGNATILMGPTYLRSSLTTTGNTTLSGTLGVTGNTTLTGNLNIGANASAYPLDFGSNSANMIINVYGGIYGFGANSSNLQSFSDGGFTWFNTSGVVDKGTSSPPANSTIMMSLNSSGDLYDLTSVSATTLTGTLSTVSQPNITTLAGVTSIGASDSTTLTGILQTAAQPNITSVGTLSSLTLEGTLSGVTTLTATTLAGTLSTASQPNITTLAGVTSIGASGSTTLTGTLQTAAQPNITSVGTLSSLTLGGALSGVTTLGTSGNVTIAGGTSGGILSIANTTASTSASTGALQVAGGAGFGADTYIGGNLNVTGTITGTLGSLNLSSVNSLGLNGTLSNTLLGNWSAPSATARLYYAGCWSPELNLFALLSVGGIITSSNGTSWSSLITISDMNGLSDICWCPDLRLFLAVGNGTSQFYNHFLTSPDGITWTSSNVPTTGALYTVCWSSDLKRIIATNAAGYILYSTNAQSTSITWGTPTLINGGNVNFRSGIWCSELSLFVVPNAYTGANTTGIYTSPDGITWTGRTTPSVNDGFSSVAWSKELGYLVAVSNANSNKIMYSTNATSWTMVSSLPSMIGGYLSVSWIPELGVFVAVGGYGGLGGNNYSISYNGTTWSSSTYTSTYKDMRSCIIWSPDLSLMVLPSSNTSSSYPIITTTQTANSSLNVVSNTINSVPSKLGMNAASQLVNSSGLNGTFKWVNATTSTQTNELMRLSKEGYLGINTETPRQLLHITAPSSSNNSKVMRLSSPGNNWLDMGINTDGSLVLNSSNILTGGTSCGLYINSADYNATRLISVLNPNLASGSAGYLCFGKSAANCNQAEIGFLYQSNGSGTNSMTFGFHSNTVRTMSISPGCVGINLPGTYNSNTGAPLYPIDFGNQTTADVFINFYNGTYAIGANNASMKYSSNNSHKWYTGGPSGTNIMTLESTGNMSITGKLGVNSITPSYLIDFGSAGYPNTMAINFYAGTRGIGASTSALNYMSDSSHKWWYQSSSITGSTTSEPSGTNTMALDSSGNLTVANNITLNSGKLYFGSNNGTNAYIITTKHATTPSIRYFFRDNLWPSISIGIGKFGVNLRDDYNSGSPAYALDFGTYNASDIIINLYGGNYTLGANDNMLKYSSGGGHAWYTGSTSGTNLMTLTSSGNLSTSSSISCTKIYSSIGNSQATFYGNWAAANRWGIGPHTNSALYDIRVGKCDTAGAWDGDNRVNVYAATFNSGSDYRLKKNIVNMNYGLNEIKRLRPVFYDLKDDDRFTCIGFIAHEVQEVIPELVSGIKDDVDENGAARMQSVNYSQMVSVLVKGIQEQNDIIDDLKAKNTDLESRLARLEAFIATLEITE